MEKNSNQLYVILAQGHHGPGRYKLGFFFIHSSLFDTWLMQ